MFITTRNAINKLLRIWMALRTGKGMTTWDLGDNITEFILNLIARILLLE